MLNILKIISILAPVTCFASGYTCFDNKKLLKIENKKKYVISKGFCINHPSLGITTRKCISDSCLAITLYEASKGFKAVYRKSENPFFQKCRVIGGEHQYIQYELKAKIIKSSICLFKDGSFVSMHN